MKKVTFLILVLLIFCSQVVSAASTSPPSAPTGIALLAYDHNSVVIGWNASVGPTENIYYQIVKYLTSSTYTVIKNAIPSTSTRIYYSGPPGSHCYNVFAYYINTDGDTIRSPRSSEFCFNVDGSEVSDPSPDELEGSTPPPDGGGGTSPTPTPPQDTTPPPNPSNLTGQVYDGVILLDWDYPIDPTYPEGFSHFNVYYSTDGQTWQKWGEEVNLGANIGDLPDGSYFFKVTAEDQAGNESSGIMTTSPLTASGNGSGGGSGGECSGCDLIISMLECPSWGEYMGAWQDMIAGAIPPPPDWNEVAGIMRDTIVPAMGQELVNRAPEIAEIFADELESREKPVAPPSPLGSYDSPYDLPDLPDLDAPIVTDIDADVPNYEPDFSGSAPFVLTDPLDVVLDDNDSGYEYPDQLDYTAPVYSSEPEAPEPDIGYNGSSGGTVSDTPSYIVTNPDATNPEQDYVISNPTATSPPPSYEYEDPADVSPDPNYDFRESEGMPDYVITP